MRRVQASCLYRNSSLRIRSGRGRTTLALPCPVFLGFVLALAAYIVYAICLPARNIQWINVLIYTGSMALVAFSVQDIVKQGVSVSNVFGSIYFLSLAANNLNISGLQREKTLLDVYYLMAGPVIFWVIVSIFDRVKIRFSIQKVRVFDPNTVAKALLLLYVVMKLCIFRRTGIRLLGGTWMHGGFNGANTIGSQYQVGGFSGIAMCSMWLALLLIPVVKNRLKIVIGATALLLDGVFMISRSAIMMMGIYFVACFVCAQGNRLLTSKKNVRILCILALLGAAGFTILGNLRQMMRGWGNNSGQVIANLLQSSTKNGAVNWLYAYTAFNHDVLLQVHTGVEHPMTMYTVFAPIARIFGGYAALADYNDAVFHVSGLRGFNMLPFTGPMVNEMGALYVVQAALLGLYVGVLSYVSRVQRAEGFRAFLIMFSTLLICGNNFTTASYFFVTAGAFFMFFLVRGPEDIEKGVWIKNEACSQQSA